MNYKVTFFLAACSAIRIASYAAPRTSQSIRPFSGIQLQLQNEKYQLIQPKLLQIAPLPSLTTERSLTKFSLNRGKRKTVKAVLKRFKRLDWGGWIRTRTGRHKKLFKKSQPLKKRLREHVFVNSTQSWLLDSMVCKFWRRPKYYIDDPYTPYHTKDYFTTSRPPKF